MMMWNPRLIAEDPETWHLSTFVVMVPKAFYPSLGRLMDFLFAKAVNLFTGEINSWIYPFAVLIGFCIAGVADLLPVKQVSRSLE